MSHKVRNKLPANWPLPRKGNKYFAIASHSSNEGIPVRIALRDILKIANTAKEVRLMLLNKEVKINGKIRVDSKFPVKINDVVSLKNTKKNYRLVVAGKKLKFEEVSDKEANKKIVKVVGKVLLSKGKYQINLEDGTNYLSKENFKTGNSAVINFIENKIEKIIEIKENAEVKVISGKHAGKEGKILTVIPEKKECLIKFVEGESKLPMRIILVIE